MEFSLMICAIILMVCILLSRLTHRLGLPSLLFFILLGMIFGSDGFFKVAFNDYHLTEQLCTIALIFIIFYAFVMEGVFFYNFRHSINIQPTKNKHHQP